MRRRSRPRRGLHGRPAPVAASPLLLSPPSQHFGRPERLDRQTERQRHTPAHPLRCTIRLRPPDVCCKRANGPRQSLGNGHTSRLNKRRLRQKNRPKTAQKRAAMARMRSPRNGTGPAAIAAQIGRKMSYIIPIENYITSPSPYVRRDRRWSWLLPLLHPCPHRSGAIRSQTVTVPAD